VRAAPFVLVSIIAVSFVLASACNGEHFPLLLADDNEGGVVASEAGLEAGAGEAALRPIEASPPALVPAAQRASVSSSPLVFDPVRGGVWTANGDVGSVSYADVDRYALVGEIAVGKDIRSVALSPDGTWIAAVDRAGGSVALIDAAARAVIRVIATGTHPRAAVWDAADPRWLYVAVEDDGVVAVIDRTLGVLSTTIRFRSAGFLPVSPCRASAESSTSRTGSTGTSRSFRSRTTSTPALLRPGARKAETMRPPRVATTRVATPGHSRPRAP
jgi:hypothetical protein